MAMRMRVWTEAWQQGWRRLLGDFKAGRGPAGQLKAGIRQKAVNISSDANLAVSSLLVEDGSTKGGVVLVVAQIRDVR
jgi:hypothetical protein